MSTTKPVVIDERKITVDGREYTLAELQSLYDAIGAVPGITQKVQTITVEKIVERDRTNPYMQPLRPYWQDPITASPNTAPHLPRIICDDDVPNGYARLGTGLQARLVPLGIIPTTTDAEG